jgi:DNA repair protein RadC
MAIQAVETTEDAAPAKGYAIASAPGRIRDIPARLRPREEADRVGVENVADDLLLAIVLRSGIRGVNVVDLARSLLRRYGSLTGMAACSTAELAASPGLGPVKAQVLKCALEIGRRLNEEGLPRKFKICCPGDVARLLGAGSRSLDTERFWVLHLDTKNTLKGSPFNVTRGILDASLVHPREVFREAIRTGAAAVILAHNHPSGDTSPSSEDLRMTRQLIEAGAVVDIKVLDHVVLGRASAQGGKAFFSMREEGVVRFH